MAAKCLDAAYVLRVIDHAAPAQLDRDDGNDYKVNNDSASRGDRRIFVREHHSGHVLVWDSGLGVTPYTLGRTKGLSTMFACSN